MNTNVGGASQKPGLVLRVHLTDGSIESFAHTDKAEANKLWERIDPAHLFAQPRLVLAGVHSKSVFVTAQIGPGGAEWRGVHIWLSRRSPYF